MLVFESGFMRTKQNKKKRKTKKLTSSILCLMILYYCTTYYLLTASSLLVLCIPILWLRDYESNWHQWQFLLNWLSLFINVIHSVSNQPNPGILKSVQGKLWACCTINVFHLFFSFFFFSFLSYSSSQKVLGDQILPEQALIHYILNGLHCVEIISTVPKGCLLSKIWENWTKVSVPICLTAL